MRLLLLSLVVMSMVANGIETLGGMTVQEAFRDEKVARLVAAASRGDIAEADAAIRAGVEVNYIGTDGISPLIWVLTSRNRPGIEKMLQAGANPNYRDAKRGASAMELVAGGDSPELLELLLQHGGDPNLRSTSNEPLLHVAVTQFREKNIEILLKHGADINGHSDEGWTVGNVAAALGRFDLVANFLERGLSYNLQRLGMTVESSRVPKDSEQQRSKDKLIEMLKARGVKFPAFVPGKAPPPPSLRR